MWLTYNYRLGKFLVPFVVWIQLMSIKLRLYLRRYCRFAKRAFVYIKPLFLIVLLATLFAGLSGILGVALGEYTVWHEAFWDLRMFLFTSVFLSAISLVTTGERSHHKKLNEQENKYFNFLFHAEQLFQNLLELFGINIEFDHFQTETSQQRFSDMLTQSITTWTPQENILSRQPPMRFSAHANPTDCLIFFLEEFIRELDSVKQFSNMLVNDTESAHLMSMCDYACASIREELFMIQSSVHHETVLLSTDILQFTEELYRAITPIIGCLRRPWRYEPDFSLDTKIRLILSAKGTVVGESYNPLIHWE